MFSQKLFNITKNAAITTRTFVNVPEVNKILLLLKRFNFVLKYKSK